MIDVRKFRHARQWQMPAVLAAAIGLCSSAAWSQTDTPSASAGAPAAGAAAAAPLAPLSLKVNVVNPEDLLDHGKTLIVPTAYLSLVTEGRVTSVKQSGLFQRGNNTARASAAYKVAGLDKAMAQSLAQAALDDFVTQLRGAGYKVLTWADVKDRAPFKGAAREAATGPLGLPGKTDAGQQMVTAAPSDEQYFKSSMVGGMWSEFIQGGKSLVADATVIIPTYTLIAPAAWAEGSRGYQSVSAEANVAPAMNLTQAYAQWMGAPKSRMMRGAPGVGLTAPVYAVADSVGTLTKTADTTPDTANMVSGLLSRLAGVGDIQRVSSEYLLTIDRAAYTAAALHALRAFNSEVAKAAAAATP